MQVRINYGTNVNLPFKIAGMSATDLYDTGPNMSCMSYMCYAKLKDPPPWLNKYAISVHSATGQDLCSMGLVHCKVTLGNA